MSKTRGSMRTMAWVSALSVAAGMMAATPAWAQKKYGPGASDTEIKVGNTMPYSGPASAYGNIGKAQQAYFKMINDQGGVNGRKINYITLDDGYSPPKTVEMTRRLIEQEQVLLLFSPLGTPPNSATVKYVNARKVPHLFLATGASKWNDPKGAPWTTGFQPNYQSEAAVYGQHIMKTKPGAKIAVIYQNDDFGKDYLHGLKEGLGAAGVKQIVSELSYEVTDPTIDSQIVQMKESGADVFVNITTPKFAAMSIRKVYDLGWKPVHYLANVSVSVGAVFVPAGPEKGIGIISTSYLMDPIDKQWADNAGMKAWREFMGKYMPGADLADYNHLYGYASGELMVGVLKAAGDDLSRENVMKHALDVKNLQLSVALPGVLVNTSPTDHAPFQSMRLMRFDGKGWELFGDVMEVR